MAPQRQQLFSFPSLMPGLVLSDQLHVLYDLVLLELWSLVKHIYCGFSPLDFKRTIITDGSGMT